MSDERSDCSQDDGVQAAQGKGEVGEQVRRLEMEWTIRSL